MSDRSPLLSSVSSRRRTGLTRPTLIVALVACAVLAAILVPLGLTGHLGFEGPLDKGPNDPMDRALWLLERTKTPIIDGHIDFPEFIRMRYANNVSAFDARERLPGHVDIPRLAEGKVGGFFWSCFTECPVEPLLGKGEFLDPTNSVRDTLEQIDVSKNMIKKYGDVFQLATTADGVRDAIKKGKIASLLGIEGAHQLGNSLASLRMYAELGVKYMTLTHSCANAFADSAGILEAPPKVWGGLSPLGKELIPEMNRLGMIVDLSHVSDDTALQALELTRAPVMWSHSSSRHFVDIQRNVPDHVLAKIGREEGKVDGVIHVNFAPFFIVPVGGRNATVEVVADHIEWIASKTSRQHVGLGSDFDGIESVPQGLEDVSAYPALFASLIRRGWADDELEALAGGNVLRVLEGVERVQHEMAGEGAEPSMARYSKRDDLGRRWDL